MKCKEGSVLDEPEASVTYLVCETDDAEAVLNGVKLLLVQLAGHDVLHRPAMLVIDVPGTHRDPH